MPCISVSCIKIRDIFVLAVAFSCYLDVSSSRSDDKGTNFKHDQGPLVKATGDMAAPNARVLSTVGSICNPDEGVSLHAMTGHTSLLLILPAMATLGFLRVPPP